MLLADMTSDEWNNLVTLCLAVAIPSTLGWLAVWVQLQQIKAELKFNVRDLAQVKKRQMRQEREQQRAWAHISKHEGRLDTHDRIAQSVLDKLDLSHPDAKP